MSERAYFAILAFIAGAFSLFFVLTVVPAVAVDWNIIGALAAGFVNPFAAGYSTDVLLCWCVLATWIYFERKTTGIKHGWICLVLGAVPGVAVGFALYLILRAKQLKNL